MYLLNIKTFRLESFVDQHAAQEEAPYAILSHTWGNAGDEITSEDMKNGTFAQKKAFAKLQGFAAVAEKDGYSYIWVDTFCIDKSSSAELSEAINAMYSYYQVAECCYAYLEDVNSLDGLERARWWSRGWTLQELLAPADVRFYSRDWTFLGEKRDLIHRISKLTGIEGLCLLQPWSMASTSVARRMSWAARRKTTRREDIAYCLLGIFGVHMPLLYGEGDNAFIRLQEEIIRTSSDQSVLAWSIRTFGEELFALDPTCYQNSGAIVPVDSLSSEFAMSNRGLEGRFRILDDYGGSRVAILACCWEGDSDHWVGIRLKQREAHQEAGIQPVLCGNVRDHLLKVPAVVAKGSKLRRIVIGKGKEDRIVFYKSYWIRSLPRDSHEFVLSNLYSIVKESYGITAYLHNRNLRLYMHDFAILSFSHPSGASVYLSIGTGVDGRATLHLDLQEDLLKSQSLRPLNMIWSWDDAFLRPAREATRLSVPGHGTILASIKEENVLGRQLMVVDVMMEDCEGQEFPPSGTATSSDDAGDSDGVEDSNGEQDMDDEDDSDDEEDLEGDEDLDANEGSDGDENLGKFAASLPAPYGLAV